MPQNHPSPGFRDFQCHHCDAWIRTPEGTTTPGSTCPGCGAALKFANTRENRKKNVPNWNIVAIAISTVVILAIYGINMRHTTPAADLAQAPPAITTPEPTETPVTETPEETIAATDEDDESTPETAPLDDTTDAIAAAPVPETPREGPQPAPDEETATTDATDAEPPPEAGWKADASVVLRQFLAATTHEERLTHVLAPERIGPQLAAYHRDADATDYGITVEDFTHADLSESDHEKGIFLMVHDDESVENAATAPLRTYAFFKQTGDGLKLDWEVFRQTRHAMFKDFIDRPQPGVSRVFRVFITVDPSPGAANYPNHRAYYITDLGNFKAATRIRVTNASPAGSILSSMDFDGEGEGRHIMRTATVELRWTDQPENSVIELSKFICWEFLGLGGEPIPH